MSDSACSGCCSGVARRGLCHFRRDLRSWDVLFCFTLLSSFSLCTVLGLLTWEGAGGGQIMCAGGLCLSFRRICRNRPKLMALPGSGPGATVVTFFSFIEGDSFFKTNAVIAIQFCLPAVLWKCSWSGWYAWPTNAQRGRI